MKKSAIILKIALPALVCVLLFGSYKPHNEDEKNALLLRTMIETVQTAHYRPRPVDDSLSVLVYNEYLKKLDYYKRFFTDEDIQQLEKYKYKIDDEIEAGTFEFYELSNRLMEKRTPQVEKIFEEVLTSPFDFSKEEMYETDPDKKQYAANDAQLKDVWRTNLKYQILTRMVIRLEEQENAIKKKDTVIVPVTIDSLERETREKVLKTHRDWYRRFSKINNDDRASDYFNAILYAFDPHSNYYPPKDKENFDINMSGRLEGIGATLSEKDGFIQVTQIVPGSASWKQGELKAGDVILKVAQGDEDPVDVGGMRLDDAVRLIRGKKGTEVRLTVKKPAGTIQVIAIVRDIVILEETYAKSAVIENGEPGKKDYVRAGYIYLPSFYADFNNSGGRSCAGDIKIELQKLRKENVQGIILDLRNNGGGSLMDVVTMSGFFIDKGPIVQVKSRDEEPYVLRDKDGGVEYGGPLIVMVNTLSASASEILAAAMQDYGRAVIVGSAHTFGKGTVQRILDLDQFTPSFMVMERSGGSMKLTTQKFYRINGGATQLKGVSSDVELPDPYGYVEIGEKEMENAMPWDMIKPAAYYKWRESKFDLNKIKKNSKNRVQKNETLGLVNENSDFMKVQREKTLHPLQLTAYKNYQDKVKEQEARFKNIQKEIDWMHVKTLQDDVKPATDTLNESRVKEFHGNLKKDAHLAETLLILKDML